MNHYLIKPTGPLRGRVEISGAKNAALPILAATLLTDERVDVTNVPRIGDIESMLRLLRALGVSVARGREHVVVAARRPVFVEAPSAAVKAMRASILVLGPLLARFGKARVALPGGCAIGARPVDLHLRGLAQMGAEINVTDGTICARTSGLRGATIKFDKVTVTGTENLMAAATLAKGITVLDNAAKEPEVVDMAEFLIAMGARISGHGSDRIVIEGVPRLHGARHAVMPDRIETGTFVCAAAATGGHVLITKAATQSLKAFLEAMGEMGLPMVVEDDRIEVLPHTGLKGIRVRTDPHPGFPTDLQAQLAAVMATAKGQSVIEETIFENRIGHFGELKQLGADIQLRGATAHINGVGRLRGGHVTATDLRAGAALVIAGLGASGDTHIAETHHVARGYADLCDKLQWLGADLSLQPGPIPGQVALDEDRRPA